MVASYWLEVPYWYDLTEGWIVDADWLPGTYLTCCLDEEHGVLTEYCLVGPQPA